MMVAFCIYSLYKVVFNHSYDTQQISYNDSDFNHVNLNEGEKTLKSLMSDYVTSNNNKIVLLSNTFEIDPNIVISWLYERNIDSFNVADPFNVGKEYPSADLAIIDFLANKEIENPALFNVDMTNEDKSETHILSLIDYFTSIYSDVDPAIAKAIAYVESGYKSPAMLAKNNIFGGIGSTGLIGYKNINYGVYRYIRLLHDGYFSKGLTTVSQIGYIYNPVVENGVKIAKPAWVMNVEKAVAAYQ